jgi:hypothetical protein
MVIAEQSIDWEFTFLNLMLRPKAMVKWFAKFAVSFDVRVNSSAL